MAKGDLQRDWGEARTWGREYLIDQQKKKAINPLERKKTLRLPGEKAPPVLGPREKSGMFARLRGGLRPIRAIDRNKGFLRDEGEHRGRSQPGWT